MRQAVLHLSSEHGWRGGERQVWLLSRGLARRGVTVVVAAPAGSPLAERAAASGIEVLELRRGRPIHPGNVMRLMVWLWRRPGAILHAQTSPALDWAAACRFLARPRGRLGGVVHTRRVSFPARRSRKYQSWADRYVAISQAVAGRLQEAGVDESRLVVIPSAVEIEPIDRARPAPELAELVHAAGQGPVVGCVGQLTAEKGHAVLVRAWAEVMRQWPAARLVLVGDGPERARIEELARSLEVPGDSMVLTGFRDDVPSWLAGFDLYVQPSLEEGLGTSVLDAMACRLPVVASRAGGLPEAVVDGETGVLVPRADAPALAQAMLELLAAPERCAFMGEAGRRRVEARFSVEAMVAGYLEVYQGLTVSDQGSA